MTKLPELSAFVIISWKLPTHYWAVELPGTSPAGCFTAQVPCWFSTIPKIVIEIKLWLMWNYFSFQFLTSTHSQPVPQTRIHLQLQWHLAWIWWDKAKAVAGASMVPGNRLSAMDTYRRGIGGTTEMTPKPYPETMLNHPFKVWE